MGTTDRAIVDVEGPNGDLTVKVEFVTATGASQIAIIPFRYTDINNHWRLQLNKASSTLELKKRVSGTDTTVASTSFTFNTGTQYTVDISMDGDDIDINGPAVLSTTDSAHNTATGMGLWTFASDASFHVEFDDFEFCEKVRSTACCSAVGDRIFAKLSDVSGCTAFEGAEFTISHNSGLWSGSVDAGGDTFSMSWQCLSGTWAIDGTLCALNFDNTTLQVEQCTPEVYQKWLIEVDVSGAADCTCASAFSATLELFE